MAVANIRPGTEGSDLLRTQYDNEIRVFPNELGIISPDITLSQGTKAGSLFTVRRIPAVTINSLATTAQADSANLTYETGDTDTVTGAAVDRYAAVGVPLSLTERLDDADAQQVIAGYRQSIQGGLEEAEDVYLGLQLFTGVSTIKGPGNFDKAALLDMKQTLRTNSKAHYGKRSPSAMHLKYHVSQIKHLENIDVLMNAELRGDDENPNVKGFYVKGLGITFAPTGNVPFSGGAYWNCLHLSTAFVKCYNVRRRVLPPEVSGLSVLYHGYLSMVGVEAFDADAVVQKSA